MRYLNRANLLKLNSALKNYSLRDFYYKVKEKTSAPYGDYSQKTGEYLPSEEELDHQRAHWTELEQRPLVSIVVPAYETEPEFLCRMVDSVCAQTYPRWQLCIADGSGSDRVERVLRERYQQEERITYRHLKQNEGISGNTNQGFALAKGEYVALLDHDDFLEASALYEMVKAVGETGAEMLYSDEDQVSADGKRYLNPHFKLDFNRELLIGNNYICHFLMISRRVLDEVGAMDSGCDGAQDYDFVLRCSRRVHYVHHVPKILYHWRIHAGSTAGNADSKQYVLKAGKRAVEKYLQQQGWSGEVVPAGDLGFFRVFYQVPRDLTIIVREWGEPSPAYQKIRRQVEQELAALGVDVSDQALDQKTGYILTLNRAIQKMTPGSIGRLLGSCARTGILEVGAKTISHGKVVQCGYWEKDGGQKPRFENLPRHFRGYMKRAWIAAEVDALGRDLTVRKAGASKEECRRVVEPAAEVYL